MRIIESLTPERAYCETNILSFACGSLNYNMCLQMLLQHGTKKNDCVISSQQYLDPHSFCHPNELYYRYIYFKVYCLSFT